MTGSAPAGSSNPVPGGPKYTLGPPRATRRDRGIELLAVCDRDCRLTVRGTLRPLRSAKRRTLTTVRERVSSGIWVTVRLPFTRADRAALARAGRAEVCLTVTVRDASGTSTLRGHLTVRGGGR